MSSQTPQRPFSISGAERSSTALERPALPGGPYLVLGLGRAGRAAVVALARTCGVEQVSACDDAGAARLPRGLPAGVKLHAGKGQFNGVLDGVRTVVKSPGIPFTHPLLREAQRRGLEVVDELELGWRLLARPLVAVTGTNGKSTTASLIAAVMQASGRSPALVGNVEAGLGVPLSALAPEHPGWAVAEVSSYQACGLQELMAQAAVFTNLTADHLHWHGSMHAYAMAKRRVFVSGPRAVELAVVNGDDPFGRELAADVRMRGGRVLCFGTGEEVDYRVRSWTSSANGSSVGLSTPSGALDLDVSMRGAHNAANVVAALALADGLGLDRERTLVALAAADAPLGRMERVDAGQPFDVYVDYAHSPDSLERVLAAMREIAALRGGRVIAVVGLAPQGEVATRAACGRVARAGCDHLVLSAWSLKGEPPLLALDAMLAGARESRGARLDVVPDRRRAIARALSLAAADDVVAVLGRGRLGQMRVDAHSAPIAFDDRVVARELLDQVQ